MSLISVQIILTIFGLFYIYTGVISFLRPEKFASSLSLEAVGISGRVEIQAQYGGFFFVAGLSQFAPFFELLAPSTALVVSVVIFGGLILGRILSLCTKKETEAFTPMIKSLYIIDGLGFLISSFAIIFLT